MYLLICPGNLGQVVTLDMSPLLGLVSLRILNMMSYSAFYLFAGITSLIVTGGVGL